MIKHNFKKLMVWQAAMDFCDHVYDYTDTLPTRERFNLISQLEKCGVSVPANISEGSGKRTSVHFAEYLTTALTSSFEAETHLLICERREYGNKPKRDSLLVEVVSLQKRLFTFRETILNQKP